MSNDSNIPSENPREEWTLGQALKWHFKRGTRPGGAINRPGPRWTAKTFAGATKVTDRTVRNWLADKNLPVEIETIERVLFGLTPSEGHDDRYAAWRAELRDAHERSVRPPTHSPLTLSASNIPIRVPVHFTGREDELRTIEQAFARNVDQTVILVLHGMRGIGKTTLAAAYGDRHRRQFRAIWWIRAHDESLMRADMVALGARLGWIHPQTGEGTALLAVMERLRYESEPILLIYDNALDADSLAPYLPRGGSARVLVTSSFHAFRGLAEMIDVQVWPKEKGAAYLIIRTGRDSETEVAEALSKALDGLPLAHEQAAAYCERLGVSLSEYLKRFDDTPVPLLDDAVHAPIDHNNRMTVARSFTLGIDEAESRHPGAEQLIVYASLMAPEPIPIFLFAEARAKFDEPFASALADDGLNEAVAALRSFALIKREPILDERNQAITTDTIRLHRLVREIASARRQLPIQDAIRRTLVNVLVQLFPRDVFDDPSTWPRARRLYGHAQFLATAETLSRGGIEGPASELLNRLASFRQAALADYDEAKSLYERSLSIREKAFGRAHPLTATSLHNLARLFRDQGHFAEARELYERALAIREKVCGPDHSETAATLNNLASLLQAEGKLLLVRPLFERALAIREKMRGPEHPQTAASLINLARILRDQKHFADALPFAERGLAIREKVLGPEHPRTAAALNVVGNILQGLGKIADAKPFFDRARAICEKILGAEHPYTATTVTNLALLFQARGNSAEAMGLFERALQVREKVLGHEHPSTATSFNDVGNLLLELHDIERAKPVFARALRIGETVLGPEHPVTAASLFGLGKLRLEEGNLKEAQLHFERVLAIRQRSLGCNHPDTVLCKEVLSSVGADPAGRFQG